MIPAAPISRPTRSHSGNFSQSCAMLVQRAGLTHQRQFVRHDEAQGPVERKADGSHVVGQAVCVGAFSFCSCVEWSRMFLGPFQQSAHVHAVAAQVHECAALPGFKSLWFGVEVELRAFPTARVNFELRDVTLGLPAIPIRPTCRRVVRRLPGRV